jgi:hypothetical protein
MRSARLVLATLAVAILAACEERVAPPLSAPESAALAQHAGCDLGVSDAEALTLIQGLMDEVDQLEADGSLNAGQASALRNHLENARMHIEAGRYCPALAQLNAFHEQVENFVEDGVLEPEEAEPLLHGADGVITGPPNMVTVDSPSSAAGWYAATGATFGPEPTVTGTWGSLVVVNDGSEHPTEACHPLVGFPAGAIAVADRGSCLFVAKAMHAQEAGAVALVVVQSLADWPPITMGGTSEDVTIPVVMVSLADGTAIRAGLPAAGTVSRKP